MSGDGASEVRCLRFGWSEGCLMDEAYEFSGLAFGGLFVGGKAALGEIIGDGVAVGAADLHCDGKLLHDVHQLGFGDGGGEDGEVGEVVGNIGTLC